MKSTVMKHCFALLIIALLNVAASCSSSNRINTSTEPCLEQVTLISRHSVRAPLLKYMTSLDSLIGPQNKWPEWSVEGGHLSLRGAMLEYLSGEYFRNYLSDKGFTTSPEQSYWGASPKQRTVETARAFACGFFHGNRVPIEYKGERDFDPKYLDSQYLPLINTWSCDGGEVFDFEAFRIEAKKEMEEVASAQTYLDANLTILEDRLDLAHSKFAKKRNTIHFKRDFVESIRIEQFTTKNELAEPEFADDSHFREANRASDALILQYYEQDHSTLNKSNAFLGLTEHDIERLASIKDAYGEILFTAPIIAVNVSHDMLASVKANMEIPGRKLTFLCTHDSTIAALLAALRAETGELDKAIEKHTPIGVKIIIEKWRVGEEYYATANLVYQSVVQLRAASPADVQDAPVFKKISFKGLTRSANGMYRYDDLMSHIDRTLALYHRTARGENPFSPAQSCP